MLDRYVPGKIYQFLDSFVCQKSFMRLGIFSFRATMWKWHFSLSNLLKYKLRNLNSNAKIPQNTNFWKIWPIWPTSPKLLSSITWMKDIKDSWFTLILVSSVSPSIHTNGSPYMTIMLLVSTVERERMKCLHTFSLFLIMPMLTCWEIDTTNPCWLLVSEILWSKIFIFVFFQSKRLSLQ